MVGTIDPVGNYRMMFGKYLSRLGLRMDDGPSTLIGPARKYPAEFVAWRAYMLITTGIDPVDDLDGYPLNAITHMQNETKGENQ